MNNEPSQPTDSPLTPMPTGGLASSNRWLVQMQRRPTSIASVSNAGGLGAQTLLASGSYMLAGLQLDTATIAVSGYVDVTVTPTNGSAITFRMSIGEAMASGTVGTGPLVVPFYGLAVASISATFGQNVATLGGTITLRALYV